MAQSQGVENSGLATVLVFLAVCVANAAAWGLPGSKSAPVHLGGGFQIENMDAFAMTVGALVLSVIRFVKHVPSHARSRARSCSDAVFVRDPACPALAAS
jgi:hypothetical protein